MRRAIMIVGCLVAGCQAPAEPGPSPTSAPTPPELSWADFPAWPSVTEQPFPVPPLFVVAFCAVAPTPDQIKRQEAEAKANGPHASSMIVVRVNPVGLANFKSGQPVPVGTVVVKEKHPQYSPAAPPTAIGVMIKREPGYDPEHGDWEYAHEQLAPPEERTTIRGKLDTCIDCHRQAQATDYLFRPYLRPGR